jgi:hypothetical protein
VLSSLTRLGAPEIHDSRQATENDQRKRMELATWLSDWHLIAFLGTTELFSQVRGCYVRLTLILNGYYRLGRHQNPHAHSVIPELARRPYST